jgi:hypothetical protein
MGLGKNAFCIAAIAVIIYFMKNFLQDDLPPVVEGFFLPEFRPVAELFR